MSDSGLTELERSAWTGFLRAHAHIRREMEHRLAQAGDGLGIGEFDVLMALSRAPRHASRMSDLAQRVVMTSGGFTRLVDRLVKSGLVTRRRCPDDGRGSLAVLTPEGVALLERVAPLREAEVREIFLGHLDEEDLRRMSGAWERILGPQDDEPSDACGCGLGDAGVEVTASRGTARAAKGATATAPSPARG